MSERVTLLDCVCGQCFECPDGWHYGRDLPCACTPDCVLDGRSVIRTPDENHPGYFFYDGPHRAVRLAIRADAIARGEVVR